MAIVIWAICAAVILVFFAGAKIIRPKERGVLERLGKYAGVKQPGFNWIVPFVDKIIYVNMTERMVDVVPQDIITQDNLNARVDLVVYFKIKNTEEDIKKSLYDVDNFEIQIVSLAQTTARNIIGDMNFSDVNSKRGELNEMLKKILDKESDNWGVDVVRVEMKEITPPADVQMTMNDVLKAQNKKDAATDLAQALETEADGKRRAEIKRAEGEAQAIERIAKAKAEAVKVEAEAATKHFKAEAQILKKLNTAEKIFKNNTKIIIDSKSNVLNLISNLVGTAEAKS